MTEAGGWARQPERGNMFWIRVITRIALNLGWPVTYALMHPITLFFVLTAAPKQREGVRRYLTRALGRTPRWQHAKEQACHQGRTQARQYRPSGWVGGKGRIDLADHGGTHLAQCVPHQRTG